MSSRQGEPSAIPARTIALLGALSAFGPLSMDFYLPGLPRVANDLGTSASAVQLTLTACLLGLALGQVIAGPVSDELGRRRPLLVGLAIFAVASLGCAVAPSTELLIGCRLAQGLAGAAGIVIGRAIVRDRVEGPAAARTFAALVAVSSAVPVLAPLIGAQVLTFGTWRTVFVFLTIIGAAMLAWVAVALPESLPMGRRHSGGTRNAARTLRRLLTDRAFVGCLAPLTLISAALFLYIAGSPFVLQGIYGVSAQTYGWLFALNAVGIVSAGVVSRRLVDRVGPELLLRAGLALAVLGGAGLVCTVFGDAGLAGIIPSFFCVVSAAGLTIPNATALALADHADSAGSASALLGASQFGIGAVVAPLAGIAGENSAVPLALLTLLVTVGAVVAYAVLVRPRIRPPASTSTV